MKTSADGPEPIDRNPEPQTIAKPPAARRRPWMTGATTTVYGERRYAPWTYRRAFGAEIVSGEIFAPPSESAEPETEMARF
jgi:hypothetical protein